jgi:MFS family permease
MIDATGFAFLNPALYSVVAANSPPGRSSTAQGLFGAAGTVGFIAASLIAGVLAAVDIL